MSIPQDIVADGNKFIGKLRHRRQARVIIISGPSGVGKDAVIDRLREWESDTHFAITATTRDIREKESHGVHYFFVTGDEFEEMASSGKLLEHAIVYGNRYGVPRAPVREALGRGQDVIIKIDVQGAAAIKAIIPDAVSIFLAPESMESLYTRLSGRKTDDADALARRFAEACVELHRANEFDYLVFNETNGLLRAIEEIRGIIATVRSEINQPSIAL